MRAPRGFGPQNLYYRVLKPYFERPANALRLRRAFLGSACEQWLNGEFFQALLESRPTLWVRPELAKRDLVLFRSDQDQLANRPALIVESKVVYASEAPSVQRQKLAKLARQLEGCQAAHPTATVVGLVVFFQWSYRQDAREAMRPYRWANRPPFLPRAELPGLGLRNAFSKAQRDGLKLPKTGEALRLGAYEYELDVALEMFRVAA